MLETVSQRSPQSVRFAVSFTTRGSQRGTAREIAPVAVSDDEVRARDIAAGSNAMHEMNRRIACVAAVGRGDAGFRRPARSTEGLAELMGDQGTRARHVDSAES